MSPGLQGFRASSRDGIVELKGISKHELAEMDFRDTGKAASSSLPPRRHSLLQSFWGSGSLLPYEHMQDEV